MQTGYMLNKAKAELANTLIHYLPAMPPGAAAEIVEKITALLDAGIGTQNHPGSPLTNQ